MHLKGTKDINNYNLSVVAASKCSSLIFNLNLKHIKKTIMENIKGRLEVYQDENRNH